MYSLLIGNPSFKGLFCMFDLEYKWRAQCDHVTRGMGMGLVRQSMLKPQKSQDFRLAGVEPAPSSVSMPALGHVTMTPCNQVITSSQPCTLVPGILPQQMEHHQHLSLSKQMYSIPLKSIHTRQVSYSACPHGMKHVSYFSKDHLKLAVFTEV